MPREVVGTATVVGGDVTLPQSSTDIHVQERRIIQTFHPLDSIRRLQRHMQRNSHRGCLPRLLLTWVSLNTPLRPITLKANTL